MNDELIAKTPIGEIVVGKSVIRNNIKFFIL